MNKYNIPNNLNKPQWVVNHFKFLNDKDKELSEYQKECSSELTCICKKYENYTDKGPTGSYYIKHNYTEIYGDLLRYYKNRKNNILEVGIRQGGSLKMWEEYFQNSTTSYPIGDIYPLGFQNSHQLPFADAKGDDYGTTGNSDYRGYIYLWGGIVQKNRGYFRRNPTSPYNQADIGMDKSYHYDENLDCNPPPFYPAIEFNDGSGEISINMAGYTSTF